MVASGGLFVCV